MRVLVTGATGLLGATLVARWREAGVEVVSHGRDRAADVNADLTDRGATLSMLATVAPDALLNLAAMSNVDACEQAPAVAERLHVEAVGTLVEWWVDHPGVRLVLVGTDQVYSRPGPSREEEVAPVNAYGRSKEAGDRLAIAAGASVVRTNFFGPSRHPERISQSDWFLRALRAGEPFTAFTDITFSPLRMETVAAVLRRLLVDPSPGVLNLGSRGPMTKYEFARALARIHGLDPDLARPGEGCHLPGRAPRPADTSMDPARLEAHLGEAMPALEEELERLDADA